MSITLLSDEIDKINSGKSQDFVISSLENVAPQFWTAPCSSTGKYHPPEDQGEGGLVRHIIKGTAVVEEFSRRAMFSPYEQDLAIAAYLLHDCCKNGIPWGEYTDYTHGLIASKWLQRFELSDEYAKSAILDGVRYHMAPWCYFVNPFGKDSFSKKEMLANIDELQRAILAPSRIELAVREADYWSSRQDMSFMPGFTVVYDKRVHDSPEKWLDSLAGLSRQTEQVQ